MELSDGDDDNGIINIKLFIENRIPLIREDYFVKNKNVQEAIKFDMQLPEMAIERLEEMCK